MPVQIVVKFDRSLYGNPAVQKALWNAARFIRDLWLSRAPNLSGAYARGLQKPQSIIVRPGEIVVQNLAPAAGFYESGTRAFNWGLETLRRGKNVKTSKDGFKYKVIHIKPQGRVAFRKPTVGLGVIAAFRATIPKGRTTFAAYQGFKDIGRYKPRAILAKPLKAKKPLAAGMSGFFVVSERAIRENPRRWFHERVEGHFVARDVQREAEPIVARALAQVSAAEAAARARPRGSRS